MVYLFDNDLLRLHILSIDQTQHVNARCHSVCRDGAAPSSNLKRAANLRKKLEYPTVSTKKAFAFAE